MANQQVTNTIADAVVAPRETLECRSFWKAGDNFAIQKIVTPSAPAMLEHARVHPKFLHSNATSHKWACGAIAELLDNVVDEIQNGATFIKIDKIDIVKDNSPALVFRDDGGGMDPDGIRKCMSLGYSTKKSNTTIGQCGNGFKTSTMRLSRVDISSIGMNYRVLEGSDDEIGRNASSTSCSYCVSTSSPWALYMA